MNDTAEELVVPKYDELTSIQQQKVNKLMFANLTEYEAIKQMLANEKIDASIQGDVEQIHQNQEQEGEACNMGDPDCLTCGS